MPEFSVIVPVYNVAPWLRECLDSVSAQTFTDWECLCVDDGSTDGSGAILDEYAAKDARFRVIHQENRGLSAARNRALDAVRGRRFCFLDSDDAVSPEWLEDFARGFRETQADAVRSGLIPFPDGAPLPAAAGTHTYSIITPEDDPQQLTAYFSAVALAGYACLCAWRSDCFLKERFSAERIYIEDLPYTLRLLSRSRRIAQSAYCGYAYRQRTGSLVTQTLQTEPWLGHLREMAALWRTTPLAALLPVLTRAVWRNLSFALAAGTREQCREVYAVFKELDAQKRVDPSLLPRHWRVCLALFLTCGAVFPVRLLRRVLDSGIIQSVAGKR